MNAPVKVSSGLLQTKPSVDDLYLSSLCPSSTVAAARNQESLLTRRRWRQSMTLFHGFAFPATNRFVEVAKFTPTT